MSGSKRFGCFWACILFLAGLAVSAQTDDLWGIGGAGVIWLLLLASTGDQRKIGVLLTLLFFAGSTVGVLLWSWWAIPMAFGVVLVIAQTHGAWITRPLMAQMSSQTEERESKGTKPNKGGDGPLYAGGDGSSPEQAVVIRGVNSNFEGVNAEYEYLRRILGRRGEDWQLRRQSVLETNDGRYLDKMTVEKRSGETVTLYFDVSSFYGSR